MSRAYAHKMKVRDARTFEREALKEAKDIYRQRMVDQLMDNGVSESDVDALIEEMQKKDRSKVTQIKKTILVDDQI